MIYTALKMKEYFDMLTQFFSVPLRNCFIYGYYIFSYNNVNMNDLIITSLC